MRNSTALLLAVCGAALLAGCKPAHDPSQTPSASSTESATPEVLPSADASGTANAAATSDLDFGALADRQDPERLLRFYTNAIRVGDWSAAARAWSSDAQMTSEKLEAEFGGDAGPKLAVGKGDMGGAAGSLYYEAPLVVDFSDGRPSKRGTIVLRRVNDVPGASEEQLNWRIERTSTLVP